MSTSKGGRPPFVPTSGQRDGVRILAAAGLTHDQIARAVGISENTLRRAFKDELAYGFDKTYAYVVGKLMANISAGDRSSIFFWLKTRARWTETHNHQIGGLPDASPINVRNLTDDQLLSALAAATAAESEGHPARGTAPAPGED